MGRVVVAADAEATLAVLAEMRGAVRIHVSGNRGGMRFERDRLDTVGIDRTAFDVNLDADVGPVDTLVFGQVTAGAVGFRAGGAEHWHRDSVYLAGQPGRERTSMIRGGIHDQVVIDSGLPSLIAHPDPEPGPAQRPVRFTGYEPVSSRAAQAWRDAYAYVRGNVLDRPGTAGHRLIAAAAARHLVAVALAVFPNTTMTAGYVPGPGWVLPAGVRRAADFIDAMADQPVSLGQIAVVAGVTGRDLRSAFRRYYGTTPMGYLRQVRLDRAHAQLRAADPADTTAVASVARKWGWANPGQFAAAYRQRFGVPPGRTLRN
jgi:AraC-like DNA-binding protein